MQSTATVISGSQSPMELHNNDDGTAQDDRNGVLKSLATTLQGFDDKHLSALLDLSVGNDEQSSTNRPSGVEDKAHEQQEKLAHGAYHHSLDDSNSYKSPTGIILYLESDKSRLDTLVQAKPEHCVQINKSQLEDLATLCQDRMRNKESRALVVVKYLGQTHPSESWSSQIERAAMAILGLQSKEDSLMDVFHHCLKWSASRLIEAYRPRTTNGQEMTDTSKSRQMVCNIFRGAIDARNERLSNADDDLSLCFDGIDSN